MCPESTGLQTVLRSTFTRDQNEVPNMRSARDKRKYRSWMHSMDFAGIIGSTSQHWTSKQVATSTVHIWPYCVPHISVEKFAPPERRVRLPVVNISHFSEGSVQCIQCIHLKMDPAEKALMTSFGHGVFANLKVRKLVWSVPAQMRT